MRKVGAFLVAVLFAFNAWFVGYSQAFIYTHAIKQLAVSSATWVAGAGIRVPALATMTSAGASGAMKWIPLMIPQVRVAKIGASVIYIAGSALVGYGGDKLINWMQDNDFDYQNGVASAVTPGDSWNVPSDDVVSVVPYNSSGGYVIGDSYYIGTFASEAAAMSQAQADRSERWSAYTTLGSANLNDDWAYYYNYPSVDPFKYSYFRYLYPRHAGVYPVEYAEPSTYTPADLSAIETALTTDLAAENSAAIAAATQALEIVAQGLTSSTSIAHSDATGWATIQGELDNSITAAQKDAIEGDAIDADEWAATVGAVVDTTVDNISAGDVQNAVIAALVAQGLSHSQIQAAMEAAIQAKADVFSNNINVQDAIDAALTAAGLTDAAVDAVALPDSPVPTEPGDLPEKSLITTVLQSFMAGLSALPVVEMLTDLQVDANGNSSIAIDIPGFIGGNSQSCSIDFAQWAAQFQFMGSILLMLCGLRWTIWLFQ